VNGWLRLILSAAVVAALLSTSVGRAQVPASTSPLTLGAAFDRALQVNPGLVSARLRGVTNRAAVDVARERLNPEFRAEFEKETPTRAYGVSVPWEAGGKRDRRIAVSEAAVRTGDAELAQIVIELRAAVRRAYFNRVVADARLTLLGELRDLSGRARDAARERFEAGSAPRLEYLQSQLAFAQAENEATAAGGETVAARAALNALLDLPLDAATPLAASLDPAVLPTAASVDTTVQSANAELAVFDRRLEEQRARVALARALQVPDVTPEVTLTRGAEPEFSTGWRAAVAVAVPVFTHHRAGVNVEEAALAQLVSERAAALIRIRGEVTSALAHAEAQRQQYLRYRDEILPQALEVERMAEDSYRLGQTVQATRDARLRALQAAAEFQGALADLERAVGAPLP
jgi:cobalt-zinc-cadmium efflux system outer membrane protein